MTVAYVGLAGYLVCIVLMVGIVWWAIRNPVPERDQRLARVDAELDLQEEAARRHAPAARRRPLDSLELFAILFAALFVAGAYALISGGLV